MYLRKMPDLNDTINLSRFAPFKPTTSQLYSVWKLAP